MVFDASFQTPLEINRCDEMEEIKHYMTIHKQFSSFVQDKALK
jgi:hypothetical protein